MVNTVLESYYPLTFREQISEILGKHLKNRQSVIMIGMRRVGISNFLRFFLNHEEVIGRFIHDSRKHIFIPVDLNDLVERKLFPFWMLTLKRIVDAAEKSNLDNSTKKYIENLFLDSIQSQNLFLLVDCVRLSLTRLIQAGFTPTLFLIHFDRIKDAVTPEFFTNLEGLRDATNNQLIYVLTSFRKLDKLVPKAFSHASPSLIMHQMFIKPAKDKDLEVIFKVTAKRYHLDLPPNLKQELLYLVGGYIQYLQLTLITLSEKTPPLDEKMQLLSTLTADERINMQSEELWDSLTYEEQNILIKIASGEKISEHEKNIGKYLWDTGLICFNKNRNNIFSPIFEYFLKLQQNNQLREVTKTNPADLSKKEYLLFTYLQNNIGQVCEREAIISAVWPEEEELGVSDWAIDRLVARVRSKLKQQKSDYEIITVKTRGYKLISTS